MAADLAYVNTHFSPFFLLPFPSMSLGELLNPFLSSFLQL